MTTFTIDTDNNNITAYADPAEITNTETTEGFTTAKQLGKLAATWPAARLVEIWNSLPGQKPVKKFTNRETAVARIWTAIQTLVPDTGAQAAPEATKKTRAPKQQATAAEPAHTAREGSKTNKILDLLKQPGGATLHYLMTATGWQAHSVRGFISAAGKKHGINIQSSKNESGDRVYKVCE